MELSDWHEDLLDRIAKELDEDFSARPYGRQQVLDQILIMASNFLDGEYSLVVNNSLDNISCATPVAERKVLYQMRELGIRPFRDPQFKENKELWESTRRQEVENLLLHYLWTFDGEEEIGFYGPSAFVSGARCVECSDEIKGSQEVLFLDDGRIYAFHTDCFKRAQKDNRLYPTEILITEEKNQVNMEVSEGDESLLDMCVKALDKNFPHTQKHTKENLLHRAIETYFGLTEGIHSLVANNCLDNIIFLSPHSERKILIEMQRFNFPVKGSFQWEENRELFEEVKKFQKNQVK